MWLSLGSLYANFPPLWGFLASLLCPWPILFVYCLKDVLIHWDRPHTGSLQAPKAAVSALSSKENFQVLPSLVPGLWQHFLLQPPCFGGVALLPSSGFGKVSPFPDRSSSIKGAFCNETEAGQSFVKVSARLTPRAQEQELRLLIPPPVSIDKPLVPDVSFYCP